MLDAITNRFGSPDTDGLDAPRLDCDVDTIGHIIGNQRRRLVIQYLQSRATTTLSDVAEFIARQETGSGDYTSDDRKTAYVVLYQHHLDHLQDAQAIEWDKDRKTIQRGPNYDGFAAILDALDTATGGEP